MFSYYIWTMGCQMNQAYVDQVSAALAELGCRRATSIPDANLILVNTCVVRQSAENRALSRLHSLRPIKETKPEVIVALAGCMVDSDVSKLKRRFPHVDLFLKPGESDALLELVGSRISAQGRCQTFTSRSTAFVPVIEGCDNFCSYCIVPYRRGRERSRPVQDVRCEVENLVRSGVREITLLGQNVDSYGHDLPERPDLADLLADLNSIPGLHRIRFLTSHPKDMHLKLIQSVAALDKVCESISLPVQSGDDEILKAMRRGYTVKDYRKLVGIIRHTIPGVALTTDVIVGFPGESEKQFSNTLNLLAEISFDTVHVAAYSPRPTTVASREFEDDVPAAVKKERLQKVEALQESIASEINRSLDGHVVEVLVEGKKKGKLWGRTRSGKLAFFQGNCIEIGQLVDVKIDKTSAWALQGQPSPG